MTFSRPRADQNEAALRFREQIALEEIDASGRARIELVVGIGVTLEDLEQQPDRLEHVVWSWLRAVRADRGSRARRAGCHDGAVVTLVSDQLMQWAAIGSRVSGFHHDSASKLQSLMMALDESTALIGEERPEVARSLEVAMTALRELQGLLTENRALAKAPARKDIKLAELLKRASARAGVELTGDIPELTVHVAPPSMVQAIALLLDVHAGPALGARAIAVDVKAEKRIIVTLSGIPPATSALDPITVATWLVEREDGAVFSAPRGVQLHLPLAATP